MLRKKSPASQKRSKLFRNVWSLEVYMHHALRRTSSECDAAVGMLRFLIENGRTYKNYPRQIYQGTDKASEPEATQDKLCKPCNMQNIQHWHVLFLVDLRNKNPQETRMHSESRNKSAFGVPNILLFRSTVTSAQKMTYAR